MDLLVLLFFIKLGLVKWLITLYLSDQVIHIESLLGLLVQLRVQTYSHYY